MTDHQNAPSDLPRPGYYADPAGGPHRRWWDGRAWTENLETATPYVAAGPDGRPVQPELPAGTKVNTPWAWAFALLPLVSLIIGAINIATIDLDQYMREAMEQSQRVIPTTTPQELIGNALSILFYGIAVALAFLDHRALTRLGVVRPFHWAWAFLFVIPYAIGRGVVLRRRVGRGLAPMWVYLGIQAVGLIWGIVLTVQLVSVAIDSVNSVGFS